MTIEQTDRSFLGTGWSFPPTFTLGGADVEMASGVEDIHQSLQVLFSTNLGERVMQDGYGVGLMDLLFEEMDQALVNAINRTISDAILFSEPRITLDTLDVSRDDIQDGLLLISLTYTIKSTNSRYNMVYPFYLNEASVAV